MKNDRDNRFFALRHGQSEANVRNIIVSDPEIGCESFGLSEDGIKQLNRSANAIVDRVGKNARVVTSDFLRTRQTAEIVAGYGGVEIEISVLLRERYFGDLDGEHNSNYAKVWNEDRLNSDHSLWAVESVSAVAQRMGQAVEELNETASGVSFVIVSHGDPLQILETMLLGFPLGTHRDREPLQPGELRELTFCEPRPATDG